VVALGTDIEGIGTSVEGCHDLEVGLGSSEVLS